MRTIRFRGPEPRVLGLILVLLLPAGALAQPIPIDEWDVPWERTRPRDPFPAPDGRVWFCGQTGGYLAYLVPGTGEFRRFDLGEGAGPHNLIVDGNGTVWYAGNRRAHIGRLDPETGAVTRYDMPDPRARDPHTLVFDGKGGIWFTVQSGNFVGRLTMDTGEVRLVEVPTAGARPYGIKVDSKGRPWIALFGTNRLATVDPETFDLDEIELPRTSARPRRVAVTADDAVWYVDYADGLLGRYDPGSGAFEERPLPSGRGSRPYAMEVDDAGRIWLVETGVQPNRFVGFDPGSGTFFSQTDVPSGGGTVRHMVYDADSRAIWFGADTNTIGKARVHERSTL